jgi:hypothetical protein
MFVGKTRNLRRFTRVGSSLIHKFYTRLEGPAIVKHSSLLRAFVNYSRKKSFDIDCWSSVSAFVYELTYVRLLDNNHQMVSL